MATTESFLKSTAAVTKKIIVETAKYSIPLTPENYHIWFEYFIGSNKELEADIDDLINSNKPFTSDISQKLYTKHFNQEKNDLKDVHKKTNEILQQIVLTTLSTTNCTSDYSDKMEKYCHKIKNIDEPEQIQHVIEDIIKDTNNMAKYSKQLNEKIEAANLQINNLSKKLEESKKDVLIDALTGLNNRKAFDSKLRHLFDKFNQNEDFFSILMLDIDYFKKFNDEYGHQIGDEVLRIVGSHLKENLKGKDFPSRYGGEEFVVILPNTTIQKAKIVAEIIRNEISNVRLKIKKTGKTLGSITISIGVSEIRKGDTFASVVERADLALCFAKNSGRNNVKSEEDIASQKTGT